MSHGSRLQMLLGIEGLALLRLWMSAEISDVEARIDEVRRLAEAREQPGLSRTFDVAEADARDGYEVMAATYDDAPNPLVALEQPVVRALLDAYAPMTALDAACGTGRHAEYLLRRGHRVIGVDAAREMLAARRPSCRTLTCAWASLPRCRWRTTASTSRCVRWR